MFANMGKNRGVHIQVAEFFCVEAENYMQKTYMPFVWFRSIFTFFSRFWTLESKSGLRFALVGRSFEILDLNREIYHFDFFLEFLILELRDYDNDWLYTIGYIGFIIEQQNSIFQQLTLLTTYDSSGAKIIMKK
jgi:hypothetical protein